jgi:hypothetical protein
MPTLSSKSNGISQPPAIGPKAAGPLSIATPATYWRNWQDDVETILGDIQVLAAEFRGVTV